MKNVIELFASLEDKCYPQTNISFSWEAKGIGFGEFIITWSTEEKCLEIETETMSKEFVKRMLCQMVDDAVVIG